MSLSLAVCGAVVAVDQATKSIVRAELARGEQVEVLPFLALESARNTGIAFGLAGDASALVVGLGVLFVVVLLGAILVGVRGGTRTWVAAGLVVGGALGNLADRVRDGAVTDFIELPAWPTFNLADVAITVGVALLLLAHLGARATGPEGGGAG